MKRNCLLGLGILIAMAVMAVPVMAAPVDLRSTMQSDQSLKADIAVPVFTLVNSDADFLVGQRLFLESPASMNSAFGPTTSAFLVVANGSEVTVLSVGIAPTQTT